MFSQPLTARMDGVGEVFRTKPRVYGTTRLLIFLRTVIFLIAVSPRETISYGKTSKTPCLS